MVPHRHNRKRKAFLKTTCYGDFYIKFLSLLKFASIAIIPLGFLGVFYFYPLSVIFFKSLLGDGPGFISMGIKVLNSSRMLKIIWFTFWQAGISTGLTLIAAFPCAFVMARFSFPGKKILLSLATIPFVLPTIVVAAAFQALAGEHGLLHGLLQQNSLLLIFFAHVFYNFSVVLRVVTGFWTYIGNAPVEAASMLGAGSFQIFFKIILPLLKPALLSASMLVFIFCFSSFGVILILGGPSFSTIEVEIYRQAAHLFNLPMAAFLSLIQIVFTFAMMFIYTRLQKKVIVFQPASEASSSKKPESLGELIVVIICVIFILSFCTLPLLVLIFESISYNGTLSLIFYKALFLNTTGSIFYISPVNAMSNSLVFAFAALVMALVIGVGAALSIQSAKGIFSSFLDPLFMLPLSTSAVTLGFGIIISLDKPPLNLRASPVLIPMVHALVAFPFVVRAVLPAIQAIPASLKESASLLGASPAKVWYYVDFPIMARAFAVGAIFAFTVSLGEFGATIFTARPESATIPLTIYKFLGQPGTMNYGQAMAVSSLLMMVTAAGFMVIEKFRIMGRDGF